MPRRQKSDPVRYCEACGRTLERKRFNGRLEDRNVFLKRRYCDRKCMALAFVSDTASSSALHKRVTRSRGTSCESCGATTRLHAHHIDGNLQNDSPTNIQTLCASCHASHHHRARRAGKTVAGRLALTESPTASHNESTDLEH